MRILCLEQGDWVKPRDFPSNGRDWEARRYTDFDISLNRRAHRMRGHPSVRQPRRRAGSQQLAARIRPAKQAL